MNKFEIMTGIISDLLPDWTMEMGERGAQDNVLVWGLADQMKQMLS